MAYRELIKNFDKFRDYMRDFYVYGFRTRSDFDRKSERSYDNERRRVESWLKDAMAFRQDATGKRVFISVDNRSIAHNPFYQAFKAKSFTDKDIVLHFYLLDLLADGEKHTLRELSDALFEAVQDVAATDLIPDDATIRNKLREYVKLGLIRAEKSGREMLYYRADCEWDRDALLYAAAFASEAMPLGVIGSYYLDKYAETPDFLSFKHHYISGALDSEVLEALLNCRNEHRKAEIHFFTKRSAEEHPAAVYPLRVLISTQSGRENLLAYSYTHKRPRVYRLDRIRSVKMLEEEPEAEKRDMAGASFLSTLWGVSAGPDGRRGNERITMQIHASREEDFIVQRLMREKRGGTLTQEDEETWRFEIEVSDAMEMMPWIRTFTGRIVSLECSNPALAERFYGDLDAMAEMYGVE
ncbi:MAG: WYL domain-containing protein [Lachnospiraceae bacterium]|nr:WYL domain-containing protein [Lachnospiraceae bacterium]